MNLPQVTQEAFEAHCKGDHTEPDEQALKDFIDDHCVTCDQDGLIYPYDQCREHGAVWVYEDNESEWEADEDNTFDCAADVRDSYLIGLGRPFI